MMKRNISLSACGLFGLLAGLCTPLTYGFSDVPLHSIVYPAVKYFKETQLLKGYEDGTFRMDDRITRAAALKLIVTGTGEDLVSHEGSFEDVPNDAWFTPYVMHAAARSVVRGDAETGLFHPGREVNRAEYIKMILASFEVDPTQYTLDDIAIDDVPADSWFAPYIQFAVKYDILPLRNDNTANPGDTITRGEAVYLLYKTLERGRGLDPQIMINLSERHLSYSLELLQGGELSTSPHAVFVARYYLEAMTHQLPDHPTVQAALAITDAIENLIGGYIAGENGILEDIIVAAKAAWADAEKAKQLDPNQITEIANNIQTLASDIANKARAQQAELSEE